MSCIVLVFPLLYLNKYQLDALDLAGKPVQFARFVKVVPDWKKQNFKKEINNGNMRGKTNYKLPMASNA